MDNQYGVTNIMDLKRDLQQMNKDMKGKDTAAILHHNPEIGQFLSSLSKNEDLLLDPDGEVNSLVIKCILSLSKLPLQSNHGVTGIDRRAQSWATTQLHNISYCGYYEHEKTLLDVFHVLPSEYNQALLKEVEFHLEHNVKDNSESLHHESIREWVSNMVTIALKDDNYYTGLPSNIKILCWLHSVPLFEKEILSLVRLSVEDHPYFNQSQVDQLLNENELLVRACSQHERLCWYAFEVLRFTADAMHPPSPSLILIMSSLARKIQRLREGQLKNAFKSILFHDGLFFLSASSVIPSTPQECLEGKTIEYCIQKIAEDVTVIEKMDSQFRKLLRFRLYLTSPWIEAALFLLINGSEEVVMPCLRILCCYWIQPDMPTSISELDTLQTYVLTLRSLKGSSEVQASQVILSYHKCVSSLPKTDDYRIFCMRITKSSLLFYKARMNIFKDLYLQITNNLSSELKIDGLLRCLESMMFYSSFLMDDSSFFSCVNFRTLVKELLASLLSQATTSDNNRADFLERARLMALNS